MGTIKSCGQLREGDETELMKAIHDIGPISIAIDASTIQMRFYRKGVLNPPRCSSTDLDHAVLAVGYGSENGEDYWLVKNSWGTSWGENGYVKIARNVNNVCGVASTPSYPTISNKAPLYEESNSNMFGFCFVVLLVVVL